MQKKLLIGLTGIFYCNFTQIWFWKLFINWLKILYNSPTACVRTNAQTSSSFYLKRGTRQGCPLSPSLFAIFIEPLAAAIRQATVIKGIKCKNVEHKVSLYADDVLLFLQHSQTTFSEVITLINSFSRVSDYSINWLNQQFFQLMLLPEFFHSTAIWKY